MTHVWKTMLVSTRQIKVKILFYVKLLRLSPLTIQFQHGYKRFAFISFSTKLPSWKILNDIEAVKTCLCFCFAQRNCGFFIIPIYTYINSIRKILGNQVVFTPSIKVIPFAKYLSFHLGVFLVHANWANLIKATVNSNTLSTVESADHDQDYILVQRQMDEQW